MAQDDHSGAEVATVDSSHAPAVPAGTAVIPRDAFENPGFPAHHERVTDLDPGKRKTAERVVYTWFYLSLLGSVLAVAAYMLLPIESESPEALRLHTLIFGLAVALSLLAIGFGMVHWRRTLISNIEVVDERHPTRGTDATREKAVQIFRTADEESGFTRRALVRNSLLGALIVFPLPAVVLFRGLAPQDQNPVELLNHTMWKQGTRLTLDPSGVPIRASDVTIGSAFHVIPEGLTELSHDGGYLEEKAKAAVLLMRLPPEDLNEAPERATWSYDGIVAYSKICTHVGCPVALYEQHTHHLLCPCHQSQFDVANHARVIFGPAARPLPQLPITVDDEGYLVAQSDFTEPVGPSFWERS